MQRREIIALLGGAAVWPLTARAQQPAMPVVGLLMVRNLNVDELRSIQNGLKEGGYIESRNLAVIYRSADGQIDRLAALATDLVDSQVSAILAVGGPVPARSARAITNAIPIVFAYGGDPVRDGLVDSFNRPGGNVTGITFIGTALVAKRLELLREIVPGLTEVGLLVNPKGTLADSVVKEARDATRTLGLHLHVANVTSETEIDAAFVAVNQENVGGLIVGTDPIFGLRRNHLIALAARYKIPAIYGLREYTVVGGLISYGGSRSDTYQQAGAYVARILKGEKPADLPVMRPNRFELVINLKTAKALGITVPATLLARADEVID